MPIYEIRDFRGTGDKSMLVHNRELGQALARVLGKSNALLMRGHGGVVVGQPCPKWWDALSICKSMPSCKPKPWLWGGQSIFWSPTKTRVVPRFPATAGIGRSGSKKRKPAAANLRPDSRKVYAEKNPGIQPGGDSSDTPAWELL